MYATIAIADISEASIEIGSDLFSFKLRFLFRTSLKTSSDIASFFKGVKRWCIWVFDARLLFLPPLPQINKRPIGLYNEPQHLRVPIIIFKTPYHVRFVN